jgi:hypothetical protein|tara:strand:+ start:470 stop:994 length:525 start_codon:yes stop_codon:yes gene_type:complete
VNEDLDRLLGEDTAQEIQMLEKEGRKKAWKRFKKGKREKELFPRKLEMAQDIFRWGREILASEEWCLFKELDITWGKAITVYGSADWGHRISRGCGASSGLSLHDDGSFGYSYRAGWTHSRSFSIHNPEMLAEKLRFEYIGQLHDFSRKGVDHAISWIVKRYAREIRDAVRKQK